MMDNEQRHFVRIPLPMDVEVRVNGNEAMVLQTVDISNGGAFIKAEPEQCPAIGTELSLRVKGQLDGKEPPAVTAQVVRTTAEGMAVTYLEK
jgi:hypothetical protein